MTEARENVIEWIQGQNRISVTLYQKRLITMVKRLADKFPQEVEIIAENNDGSIFASLPLKSLNFRIISPISIEEKNRRAKALAEWRKNNL